MINVRVRHLPNGVMHVIAEHCWRHPARPWELQQREIAVVECEIPLEGLDSVSALRRVCQMILDATDLC